MAYRLTIQPDNLYDAVRAGFILQQGTLAEWCRDNGMLFESVRQTLHGMRRGDDAEMLIDKIMRAAGVERVEYDA